MMRSQWHFSALTVLTIVALGLQAAVGNAADFSQSGDEVAELTVPPRDVSVELEPVESELDPSAAILAGCNASGPISSGSWQPSICTDGINSGIIDPQNDAFYSATRSGIPTMFYADSISTKKNIAAVELPDAIGIWGMAQSGNTIVLGSNPAVGEIAKIWAFDIAALKIDPTAPPVVFDLPLDFSSVVSIVEDSTLSTPGNGRYFWVGGIGNDGGKLYRIDAQTGTVIGDYSSTAWAGSPTIHVRSLSSDPLGVTIGLGNPATVWRLSRGDTSPHLWSTVIDQAIKGASSVYSVETYVGVPVGQGGVQVAPLTIIGTLLDSHIVVIDTATGAVRAKYELQGKGIDKIAVDQGTGTAWFTLREKSALYRIDLNQLNAGPILSGTPVQYSETRGLLAASGEVWGITGTGDLWAQNVATATTRIVYQISADAPSKLLPDRSPMSMSYFAGRILVGGHWRLQILGEQAARYVSVPGEPKAQVVVGDSLYVALYPSASIYKINRNLTGSILAETDSGQMRPSKIGYSATLDRLVLAAGPVSGKFGGGLTVVKTDGSNLWTYVAPVGTHTVSALTAFSNGFIVGTNPDGEAVAAPAADFPKVAYWQPRGSTTTGTTSWSTIPIQEKTSISGLVVVNDAAGSYFLGGTANGWMFALSDTGKLLWKTKMEGNVGGLEMKDDQIVGLIDSKIYELNASRFSIDVGNQIPGLSSFLSFDQEATATEAQAGQRLAAVSRGPNPRTSVQDIGIYVPRLSGTDRYRTAVVVSQSSFATAPAVVLAAGSGFADALAAGPLAAALKAPILLTGTNSISAETMAEIKRLGAKVVHVVGGKTTIADSVQKQLEAAGITVKRDYAGVDRFETSVKIAKVVMAKLGKTKIPVMVTSGLNHADAIAAVPGAIATGSAIILTNDQEIPDVVQAFLGTSASTKTAIGGAAKLALGTKASLSIAGIDRYETSAMIARKYFPNSKRAFLASGIQYPDALTSGVVAGKLGIPLLLTAPEAIPQTTKSLIVDLSGPKRLTLIGGQSTLSNLIVLEAKDVFRG